jgi:hypothetical protein
MRLVNSKPDKFLIQCIELDLYDLMYKAQFPQTKNWHIDKEVESLLNKYITSGAIQRFNIIKVTMWEILVHIYSPQRAKIHCQIP